MADIKIEKNIPLPKRISKQKGKSKYPLAQMMTGDSFLMKNERGLEPETLRARITARFKSHLPKKFVTHIVPQGIRVWRVK